MIELKKLARTFYLGGQAVNALNYIDLRIEPGEYVSVMGPSGSGKSSLLNVLGLLDTPTSGEYTIAGLDTVNITEEERAVIRREQIGFVFQSYHLIGRLTAWENVELPMVLAGMPPKERRQKVDAVLDQLSLTDRSDHLPNQLSGGQRQRVAIGRALVMKPTILLADEPTGNLDSKSGKEVIDVLEDLNRQGITLLIVTHDTNMGQRAKRKIRIVDGTIMEDITA